MRPLAIAGTALLLAGCGAPPFAADTPQAEVAGLELTAEPDPAAPGGTVVLALRNETGSTYGYNHCFGGVEELRAGQWIPALTASKACPPAYVALAPGERASGAAALHPALPPGEYRYATRVSDPPGHWATRLVRSNRFTIPRASD